MSIQSQRKDGRDICKKPDALNQYQLYQIRKDPPTLLPTRVPRFTSPHKMTSVAPHSWNSRMERPWLSCPVSSTQLEFYCRTALTALVNYWLTGQLMFRLEGGQGQHGSCDQSFNFSLSTTDYRGNSEENFEPCDLSCICHFCWIVEKALQARNIKFVLAVLMSRACQSL